MLPVVLVQHRVPLVYLQHVRCAVMHAWVMEFGGLMQVSVAKVLVGADAAVEAREAPVAFSSGPLAEMTTSAVGVGEGDGVASAAAVEASSSTSGAATESHHVNSSEGAVPSGSSTAPDIVAVSKSPSGATVGSSSINIISPDSQFPKAALTPVSERISV